MLIEAAEGGCLEDAPWDQHRFFPSMVLCCGVWDKTSTLKKRYPYLKFDILNPKIEGLQDDLSLQKE